MSQQLLPDSATPSDPELIAAVRAGDSEAYGLLFERHRAAAMNLARQIAGPSEADDLVSEAFIKVMRVLQNGGGPDVAFRAYLLTAVRRLHVDRIRAQSKVTPSDDLEAFDPGVPFVDPAVDKFENAAAAKAFASLPERWQLVLWHLEVEGQKPADVAPLLGLSANSVSALAYRAREGLRQAYLQEHMADTAAENCRWTTERLGAYVRKGLSKRDSAKVEEHLDECAKCSALYLELAEVNSNLSAVIGPVLLGSAAAAYLGGTSAGAISATGITGLLFKLRHVAQTHTAATVSGAAAGVVAVGVSAAVAVNGLPGGPSDNTSEVNLSNDAVAVAPADPGTDANPAPPDKEDEPKDRPDKKPSERAIAPTAPAVIPTEPTTPTTPTTRPDNPSEPEPEPTPEPEPEPKPEPKPPAVVEQTPNPEDDEPAVDNPDEPGVPVITEPPPPDPEDVDVALSAEGRSSTQGFAHYVRLFTTTADPASQLTLVISAPDARGYIIIPRGWNCSSRIGGGPLNVTCTTDSLTPSFVDVLYGQREGGSPTLTATVSAADNEDPDTSNNSISYSG